MVSNTQNNNGGNVPAQLDSLALVDVHQIGLGPNWRGSNWAKESQYGLDHETIEQNELTDFMSPMRQSLSYTIFLTPLP